MIADELGAEWAWNVGIAKEYWDLAKGLAGFDDSLFSAFQAFDFEMNAYGIGLTQGSLSAEERFRALENVKNTPEGDPGPFYWIFHVFVFQHHVSHPAL
jgi:hypothetical protein